jgi:hypothetical protein
MCLRFQFCTHQRVCVLNFLLKSEIRCTLFHILPNTFLKQVHNRYNKMGIREKEKGEGGGAGRGKETFCVKLYEGGREREKL